MSEAPRQWRCVVFRVDPVAADAAANWLFEYLETGLSTELREGSAELTFYGETGELDVPALARELGAFLTDIEAPDSVEIARDEWIVEQNWAEIWRLYAQPIRVGHRILILPSGHAVPEGEDLAVVHLDPGLAFGTGSHISTRLALELLERHLTPGCRVADVGCGSGILSIAAAVLGAGTVDAVDIDPQAIEATQANTAANGVSGLVHARLHDGVPAAPADGFDLVVANLTPPILARFLPDFARALRDGGVLVGSGVLAERVHEVLEPLRANADLELLHVEEQEGWCGVACVRRPR
jgi:ribosomal protein L11 methyltransferase